MQTDQATGRETQDPASQRFSAGFGAHLVSNGLLTDLALRRAIRAQRESGERFDVVLSRLGLVPEAHLAASLAEYLGLPLASARDVPAAPLFAGELKAPFLSASKVLPLSDNGERITLAVADPFNTDAASAIAFMLGRRVERVILPESDVRRAIAALYEQAGASAERAVAEPDTQADDSNASEDVRRLQDLASEAPIIRLVQDLISRAVEMQASDIHLEPRDDSLRARVRIDGALHTLENYPVHVSAPVISRIKIMARLNIAERRIPQDGRIKATVQGRDIDLRVSTMPTMTGESVVMRVLDRDSVSLDFAALGFSGPMRASFEHLLDQPNGIILVTGPTGSGKTTTLYAALSRLNSPLRKTFTVEDPIEYQLDGLCQVQVQPKIGVTFASALRSILRQDPDIIMVGEVRDLETARVAIQASLTGHLVLSTVHTNSAAATVARLLDMGVENYLLASSLKGVLAQRLVRRLCACAQRAEPTPVLLESIRQAGLAERSLASLKQPTGCPACRNTGFRGRVAIAELLVLNDVVQQRILTAGHEQAIREAAASMGMVDMFADGVGKVLAGETTLDEVFSVTRIRS